MISPDQELLFKGFAPSERVLTFIKDNPRFDEDTYLRFVLDNFPEVTEGGLEWAVEGGMAVQLFFPGDRVAKDLDIVTKSPEMVLEFANAPGFDVKYSRDWFGLRGFPYSKETETFLFFQIAKFNVVRLKARQKDVHTLSPAALVVSKSFGFGINKARGKDLIDIELLRSLDIYRLDEEIHHISEVLAGLVSPVR